MTPYVKIESAAKAPGKPTTIKELVEFYYEFVKPLYSSVQLSNELPTEVLFEINAAFDHLTRHWAYGESEAAVVSKAASHLKRSCLDIFKIAVREARSQFEELRQNDTSIIDNGEFDRGLLELWQKIKKDAREARVREGDPWKDDEHAIYAFTLWLPIYENCVTLEQDFYNHSKVDWARKRESIGKKRERWIGFFYGIGASLVAAVIWWACAKACASFSSGGSSPSVTQPSR